MKPAGIKYSGGKLRTFFDGYGDLRFCTEDDILINPESDPRLSELVEYSNSLPSDHELFFLFKSFSGTLDELHKTVIGSYYLANVIEMDSMKANNLIDMSISNSEISEKEIIESVIEGDCIRPSKRRFSDRKGRINQNTGKMKDPKRKLKARITARKYAASRNAAVRSFNRSSRGKRLHRKLGKLVSRMNRS